MSATFKVNAEGGQADSPSPTIRVTATLIGGSCVYRVCTMASALHIISFNPHDFPKD